MAAIDDVAAQASYKTEKFSGFDIATGSHEMTKKVVDEWNEPVK